MRVVLFLLSALFLLESTKGEKYEDLNYYEREIVDKAIEQGNKHHGEGIHLDFFQIDRKGNARNVILKPTSCVKTTESVHRKECETQDIRPQVSCIDCNGKMEPCLLRKENEAIKKRMDECHMTGAAHLMPRKGENEQQLTGCLGCI